VLKRMLATAMLCLLLLGGCGPWIGDPVVEVIGEVTLDRAGSDQSNGEEQDIAAKRTHRQLAELLNEPETAQTGEGTVPAKYNLHSELEYVVDMPVGIIYPKFDLTSDQPK